MRKIPGVPWQADGLCDCCRQPITDFTLDTSPLCQQCHGDLLQTLDKIDAEAKVFRNIKEIYNA